VNIRTPVVLTDAIDALSLPAHTQVLVATSGGSDSVALALTIHALSRQPGKQWRVRLAHVNHCLRDADSDADEMFVRTLAQRLEVEIEVARVDTNAYAAEHRTSIETAARELRYDELRHMLRTWGGDVIAVGHHMDDQAETVLMNLIRGAGLDGLSGMSARSGEIVRPFLRLSKETITAALDAMGEPYTIDRSNTDPGPRRNLLRHRVLPIFEEIRPNIRSAVARTASLLNDDAEYLNMEAAMALRYMDAFVEAKHVSAVTGVFRTLHPAVQGRVLRLLVGALVGDVRDLTEDHVLTMREAITANGPPRNLGTQLPHLLRLEVIADRFHLFHGEVESRSLPDSAYLPIPGDVETASGRLQVTIIQPDVHGTLSYELVICGPHHAFCDADVLGDRLLVRSRRPGDRMSLLHSTGSRKLQDLFVDAKIPRRDRDRIPVLENHEFLVWVPGFGVDRRASISPKTKHVAHLCFRAFL
jgi:tRNA(Ile)-lysidine synthase